MNIQTQPAIQYPAPIVPRMAEYQYTLVISYDDNPENPREWDNLDVSSASSETAMELMKHPTTLSST